MRGVVANEKQGRSCDVSLTPSSVLSFLEQRHHAVRNKFLKNRLAGFGPQVFKHWQVGTQYILHIFTSIDDLKQ